MDPVRQHVINIAAREIGHGAGTSYRKYFDGVVDNAPPETVRVEWCGIFLLWVLHQAGLMRNVKWEWGKGFLYRLPQTVNPKPGDMGYKHHLNHQDLIAALDADPAYVWTIDGNSYDGVVKGPTKQPKSAFAAFYSIEPLLKDAPVPLNWGILTGMTALFGLGAYFILRRR